MTKNSIGLYFIDNYIYLCNKDSIMKENVENNIIINNRIADNEAFYKKLISIIKKYKLSDSFALKNVIVVEQPNYLKSDKELITNILEKIFNKVNYISYKDLLTEILTITINKNNVLLPFENTIKFLDYDIFFNNLNLDVLFKETNKIFLIGNNEYIKVIAQDMEQKYSIPVYWFSNYEFYIINNLLKKTTSKKI